MSLSNRSGLRQKSSALLLNGLSSNTSATLNNSKSLALNGTGGDPVLPTPVSHPSATRDAIWDEDPCPWEDENIAPHLPSIMNGPTVSASTTTNPSNQSNSLNLAASISSSSAVNSANTVESLKYMAHKRITTFVYLKKAHEGKVNWFNTILLTKPELEKWFDPSRMQRRTTRFAVLGMSLSSLLDIMTPHDFLRGLINLLHEYETIPDDNFKPKMKGMFRQSKTPRKSVSAPEYPITLQESGESSYLFTPNIPFDLDYFEIWITLCDIIVEVYQKIIAFISNASSASPQTLNPSTLNTLSVPIPPARAGSSTVGSTSGGAGSQTASQGNLSQQYIDMINKIDGKLKKLILIVTKEIDGIARAAIREELAHLDPMLAAMGAGQWES